MRSTVWIRLLRATLVLVFGATLVSVASAAPVPNRPRRPRAVNLFAGANLVFEVNRIQCFLVSTGEVCSAGGSPIGGGGFWPKGTPDQYIFNSGLQIAGTIASGAGFAWAGDTVGAYFFDARGDQAAGEALTGLFSSLNPADAATWPTAGKALDPSIYNPVLLGRNSVSQGDAWVRYWEGNPAFLTGREHPMGIVVDQRILGWNFPVGNEDIMYGIFTFYNVSASAASGKYANSTIPAAVQAEIAAQGDVFRALQADRFGVTIPDTGYALDNLFAAFAMDADVAVFNQNYSTAILPFNIGTTYTGTFLPEVGWRFPEDVFGAPFYPAAGFVGVKYLKSPELSPGVEVGLTMFSNTTNGLPFPDPVGVRQLFRYLSGFMGPTDNTCSPFTNPAVARDRRLCFLAQTQADARFYQASGPFTLPPGQARTIVVAYIQAAPVDLVQPLVGTDVKPGIPSTGDLIFQDPNNVRTIERIAGWVSEQDTSGNLAIEEHEVQTVPRSLLDKAKVAQAVFNSKFLLPFAPEAPEFYLVPGDEQVTVVWQASASETDGDPFFVVASDPGSALFDQNFRQFDVEGYRVYRGRTSSELELVAQFDYSGTSFLDFTGALSYPDENGNGLLECAPELGVTADCPTFPFEQDLVGTVVQVPLGGRAVLANGSVLVTRADTVVTGGGAVCGTAACPALENSGVPFAFVDDEVLNSFTYFYTVTAFDVNSLKSGPTSLESPRVTKRVVPRKAAPNEVVAELESSVTGDDGVELDPGAAFSIDTGTGKFSGTPPPTNALLAVFAPVVEQLLPAISLEARVDSLRAQSDADFPCPGGGNALGACYQAFVTFDRDGVLTPFTILYNHPVWNALGDPSSVIDAQLGALAISADSASVARMNIPSGFVTINAALTGTFREYIRFSAFEGQASRRAGTSGIPDLGGGASVSPGGSRWFSGTNESVDEPGYGIRVGHLDGTDTVWTTIHHTDMDPVAPGVQSYAASSAMQCFGYTLAGLSRHADVRFTWGATGTITQVRDLTHHVPVLFKPTYQASYGFVGDFNGNGSIDWRDFHFVAPLSQAADNATGPLGFCGHTDPGAGRPTLLQQPVIMQAVTEVGPGAIPADTGVGFGLYVNGERYIFFLTGGTPPATGTTWTLRTYAGLVSASTGAATTNPGGYRLRAIERPPVIPGLRVAFNVAEATHITAEAADVLANVHTVPDPYYVANALEFTAGNKVLKFVNLPPRALIRIYSLSGVLVNVIAHDDQSFGAEATWNLRNRNNQLVASGVYFYHVETPAGHTKVGRFTVVTFAP